MQSMGSLNWTRLGDFTFTFHSHALEKEMATHSSVLPWRIAGTGEPGRLPSMGLHGSPCNPRDSREPSPTPQFKSINSSALNFLYSPILTSIHAAAATKSLQSCPTPRDPIDGSPPGSPVPEILQARTLAWVAIFFSNACK